MPTVLGVRRLVAMALTAVVATLAAVLVIGPWGWVDGVEVSRGPELSGPVPVPTVEPGVLYESDDGSIRLDDPTALTEDHTLRFDVTATVQPDHSVVVVEDITQTFAVPRHGIERDIPLVDDAGEHAMRSVEVSTDAGTPGQVELRDLDLAGESGVTVRIGDPDRTITGTHRYRLTYVLENLVTDGGADGSGVGDVVVAGTDGSDGTVLPAETAPVERVALDAFSAWRQTVYGTSVVILGPAGPVAASCRQGSEFYRVGCASSTLTADGAVFEATAPIPAYNDVTVQVDWPVGTFGPAVVHGPERGSWPVRLAAIGVSLLGVVVVAVVAALRRRSLWRRTRRGVVATFGGSGAEVPSDLVPASLATDPPLEFVPPMGLRPAELLRVEQGAEAEASRLIASTVIDLAAAGELELVAAPDDDDWVARRRPGGAGRELRPYEERLLKALLPESGADARFGDRAKALGKARDVVLGKLDDGLRSRKLVERRLKGTGSSRGARIGGAFLLFAGTVGAAAGLGAFLRVLPWRPAMLLAGAAVGALVAVWGVARVRRVGRDRTDAGLGAGYRAAGFRRFFDASEEMHARAAADAGLLRQYLGYAVAFDAVDRWVAAFDAPDLTWMGATDAAWIHAWAYGSMMHRASTPPPSASSSGRSSGGFGGGFGGGSFGGGSGGGGGGSW